MEQLYLRKANLDDASRIWEILQQAIEKRSEEGSEQWQDGYPNYEVVQHDINKEYGYLIITSDNNIIGYVAIINEIEPAYEEINGNWLNNEPYLVIHRLAVARDITIKGLGTWAMQEIEKVAVNKNIFTIKVDTNFDNASMLRVFEKLGYSYCGKVYFRGAERLAYQKVFRTD